MTLANQILVACTLGLAGFKTHNIDCIAIFDKNDNLWSEQPAYFQLLFAMDSINALATEHPEWKNNYFYGLPKR